MEEELVIESKSDLTQKYFNEIQWEELIRSGAFLSRADMKILEKAQSGFVYLDDSKESYSLCKILVTLLENCTSNLAIQQYAFSKIHEILGVGSSNMDVNLDILSRNAKFFVSPDDKRVMEGPFLRVLNQIGADQQLQKAASICAACLLSVHDGNISSLIQWIYSKLLQSINSSFEIALPALTILCRQTKTRILIAESNGILHSSNVVQKVGVNGNAQQLYELLFILWSLSFGPDLDVIPFLSSGLIQFLVDLISSAPSRKVVRMSIAILKNLSDTKNDDVLTDMFTTGLQRSLETIVQTNAHKQANDPEFEMDVKFLYDVLNANYRDLSTFDRWASQVHSGALRWGIVHKEKFWRENAKFVETDDFKLLKELIRLLQSDDPTIACIALYDLGEFVRFYPSGRGVVNVLGGKDTVMEMISHPDPEVQRQALQCISKLLVNNWEFLR